MSDQTDDFTGGEAYDETPADTGWDQSDPLLQAVQAVVQQELAPLQQGLGLVAQTGEARDLVAEFPELGEEETARELVTAAAELAGRSRSGAAIGFQQTTLAVIGVIVPAGFARVVEVSSWRIGFLLASIGPLVGWLLLGRLDEIRS